MSEPNRTGRSRRTMFSVLLFLVLSARGHHSMLEVLPALVDELGRFIGALTSP